VKLSDTEAQPVTAEVLKRWSDLTFAIRGKREFWKECQLAYDRKFGESWGEISDGRSARYIPEAFKAVEKSVAQWMQGLLPSKRFFQIQGRTPTDQQNAPSAEAKLRYDMYRLNWRRQFKRACKSLAVTGHVPWTYRWRTERAMVPDEEGFAAKIASQQLGMAVESNDPANFGYPTKEAVTFEGAEFVVGDIFNFVKDRAPDDDRYAFRAYRSLQTAEYLKAQWKDLVDMEGNPIYDYLEELENGSWDYRETSDSLKREIDRANGFNPIPEGKVELITFCGDLVIPGKGYYHNIFGVVANRRLLMRFTSNPFAHGLPPWQMTTLIEDPFDPYGYGTGLLEPSLGLFDLVNVRANQAADANALAINPPMSVVPDGVSDRRQMRWGPGENLYMRVQGNIQPMPVPKEALQLSLQEIGYYTNQIADTSGVSGAMTSSGASFSATESAGIQKMGDALTLDRTQDLESNLLIPGLRMALSMNQQLMDPESPILVRLFVDESGSAINPATGEPMPAGYQWAQIKSSDIQGEFDFEITGPASVAATQQEVRDQIQLVGQLSQMPDFQFYFKQGPFFKALLEKAKFQDAWKFIASEQEAQFAKFQAQQQQAMANSGGLGGAAGPQSQNGAGGVPSVAGDAGSGGSPARTPYPEQLAGPSSMG